MYRVCCIAHVMNNVCFKRILGIFNFLNKTAIYSVRYIFLCYEICHEIFNTIYSLVCILHRRQYTDDKKKCAYPKNYDTESIIGKTKLIITISRHYI